MIKCLEFNLISSESVIILSQKPEPWESAMVEPNCASCLVLQCSTRADFFSGGFSRILAFLAVIRDGITCLMDYNWNHMNKVFYLCLVLTHRSSLTECWGCLICKRSVSGWIYLPIIALLWMTARHKMRQAPDPWVARIPVLHLH